MVLPAASVTLAFKVNEPSGSDRISDDKKVRVPALLSTIAFIMVLPPASVAVTIPSETISLSIPVKVYTTSPSSSVSLMIALDPRSNAIVGLASIVLSIVELSSVVVTRAPSFPAKSEKSILNPINPSGSSSTTTLTAVQSFPSLLMESEPSCA